MTARAARLPALLAALVAGCGGSDPAPAPPAPAATKLERCGRVRVPGHEAVGITATAGVGCSVAVDVAADAEGRGRAAYLSTGFSCAPSPASSGDTDYVCRQAGRRVSFRYGTG